MFVDKVRLKLEAGSGGNGAVAWRREKYIPKGGPTGGNGGRGGNVIARVDSNILSLESFRNSSILRAENGRGGGANRKQGRRGKDIILLVPCGTIVKDPETGDVIYDLTINGEEILLCKGGSGGRGNENFKTSTNQAPNHSTPGRKGGMTKVELELKLIADIGLVGLPNAGKSTLISQVSNVRVKIAAYPFTTLRPNLGYIEFDDFKRLLIADIPGIIKNAHKDKGLGFEFLRHIERTNTLIYVLDAAGTPEEDLLVLQDELREYNPEMLERPFLIVLNKCDLPESQDNITEFKHPAIQISALEGIGVDDVLKAIKP
jgi:GTPase